MAWFQLGKLGSLSAGETLTSTLPETCPRRHRGDTMSPETRSAVMARIKGKDTLPERQVAALLGPHGLSWESHAADLPGRPDLVFRDAKVAIFVDGDFWHGYRFPQWRDKLSVKWEEKIQRNRERDARNQRKLRRMGWKVVRLWEHQISDNPASVKRRVLIALGLELLME